ncbi:MAG: hypothetical protein ACPGU5_02535 [Lishizhenia sp.]
MSKPRIVKDYENLAPAVLEQIKLLYPTGFVQYLVEFTNKNGEEKLGLPFETEEVYYLVRMSKTKAISIIDEDEDYDEDGNLFDDVKEEYEEKHEDFSEED